MTEVTIHVSGLTRSDLVAVARHGAKVVMNRCLFNTVNVFETTFRNTTL